MDILITIIIFLGTLTLLVLVHEIGHFYTARKFGIKAEEFGIGLPPRMFGVKKGDTLFSLNWIPLGGFVKIKGEQGEDAEDEDSFANKAIWKRGIVLSAGVIMNVIFAGFLLSVGFAVGTPQIITDDISDKAIIRDSKIQIASILPDSPASNSSIKSGDTLLSVDSTVVNSISQVQEYISQKNGIEVSVAYLHDGEELQEIITPTIFEEDSTPILGVELIPTGIVSYPVFRAIPLGIKETGLLLKDIVFAFASVIGSIFTEDKAGVDLSGPVGIAVITSEVSKLGIPYLIQFAALLSLNLAIINFIPFPALDGGRFMFLMIEKVKGRAVNQKFETISHTLGFALLMLLVLVITYKDIQKYQSSFIGVWERITGVFS